MTHAGEAADGIRRSSCRASSGEVQKTSLRTTAYCLTDKCEGNDETKGISSRHQKNNLGRTGTLGRDRRSGVRAKPAGNGDYTSSTRSDDGTKRHHNRHAWHERCVSEPPEATA